MTTVLVINPMATDIMPFMSQSVLGIGPLMKGSIAALGTLENLPYTNLPGIANVIAGTATLHARLTTGRAPGEKFVVFAYSQGCQVASRWLRLHGPSLPIPNTDCRFIFIGNASRKYGGFIYGRSVFASNADYEGYPDDTPYSIQDLTRQYDDVSDFPTAGPISDALDAVVGVGTDINYLTAAMKAINDILAGQHYIDAVLNAIAGQVIIHTWYFDVTLSDKNLVKLVEGNVTYLWSPTAVLPVLAGWWWLPQYQQQLDLQQRPLIETAFSRPVTIPSPTYNLLAPPPKPRPPTAFDLAGGDIRRIAAAADVLAEEKQSLFADWIITVYDKFWRPVGAIGDDMMELSATDPRNDKGSATLKIKGNSEQWSLFQSCETTMVGVTIETQGMRLAFYVDSFAEDYTEKGERVGTAQLLGIYDVLYYYTIFPLWWLPIQAQPFSHAVYIWALCTVVESMVAEAAMRIQSGIMGFINNALSLNPDMRAWIGQLLQSTSTNIATMLKTPVYVVRNNPLLDTSPLVARTVRMESCGTVIADITKAYGVDVRVDLWLPGDDQPDVWAGLEQPTYVVTVKDRSQIEGPTKTVLDSAIRQLVDLGGSFGNSLAPIIQEVPGMSGVFHAPLLGVNFVPPWAVLVAPEPGEKGSVVKCTITHHTPKGYVHIIGGRSPKWLNDLMNAAFAWMIDSISILIGFTGIPSNLLEGFMNNTLLAFQQVEFYDRHNEVGPYHPAVEVVHATASSPYNIETLMGFINSAFDSRGWVSAQAIFRNGEVYTLGKDVFRGGLISVLYDGRTKLLNDYVEMIMFKLTPKDRDVLVQIGDGKKDAPPLARIQALVTGLFEGINVLTLAPQS